MTDTFDFLTAIKYLLEGERVCGKDWIGSCLTIDKDTNGVYNERGQRLDIMQFMDIKEWRLLGINDVSETIIDTDKRESYFHYIPDYNDILIDEFTSYTTDFEGWSMPNYYNWIFKLTNNYCPHIDDTIVYADVADCHKEQNTLDSCPVGVITKYNDYVVFVKFSNKEKIVEFSREELKQLCYILLNEEHIPISVTTVYNNETNKPYTLHLKTTSDIDYYDIIGNVIDEHDNRTDITIVDLFMNYHWKDGSFIPEFDINEFKKTLESEPDNLIDEIYEANDRLYASIPYGKVLPKEGDTVIPKEAEHYDDRSKILHSTPYDVDVIHDFVDAITNYDIQEFMEKFDKLIPNGMPTLISRDGKLSNGDEIYYDYNNKQKETFVILSTGTGSFSTKGITIQRKNNPDDIYEISLRDLHRLFTWEV